MQHQDFPSPTARPPRPPQPHEQPQEAAAPLSYRPRDGLVMTLMLFFILCVVMDAFMGILGLVEGMMGPGIEDRIEQGDPGAVIMAVVSFFVGVGYVFLFLMTVILFCVWVHGANKNARTLGADGMTFTPGWCVGWFFIPIMNLFKPYQAVKEIYKASDPGAGADTWMMSEVPALLIFWWLAWIASNIMGNVSFRMSISSSPDILAMAPWVDVIGAPISMASGLLALTVVRKIHARQRAKAAGLGLVV